MDCADSMQTDRYIRYRTPLVSQERVTAVEHIKTSDPLAFETKVRNGDETIPAAKGIVVTAKAGLIVNDHHVRGCKCRNSRCQKK